MRAWLIFIQRKQISKHNYDHNLDFSPLSQAWKKEWGVNISAYLQWCITGRDAALSAWSSIQDSKNDSAHVDSIQIPEMISTEQHIKSHFHLKSLLYFSAAGLITQSFCSDAESLKKDKVSEISP